MTESRDTVQVLLLQHELGYRLTLRFRRIRRLTALSAVGFAQQQLMVRYQGAECAVTLSGIMLTRLMD